MATNNLRENIRKLVEAFSADLESVFRRAAYDAVQQTIGNGGPSPLVPRGNGAPTRRADTSVKAKRPTNGKRVRRSPAQIESVAKAIVEYVEKHPGKRAEDIKAALKLRTTDWALPVKKLLDEGKLSTKGEKRATTYAIKARSGAK